MSRKGFIQKHPGWIHFFLAILLSLLIIVIVFLILKKYGRVGQEYKTPYVVGKYIDELTDDDDLNLTYVIIDSIYQPNQRGGFILRQDPDSGALIKKGRKIYITISSFFPDNAVVPDLRSLSVRNAISQLENVGLHGGKLVFVNDPHNAVIEQRYKGRAVAAGRRLDKGAQIDLVVGRGTKDVQVVVPYTIGMSPTVARRNILSASLNVGAEHYDKISDMSHAIVYKQFPEYTGRPGLSYGSTVELWYCDKSVVAMEELERMKQRHIEDSIRAAQEMQMQESSNEANDRQYDLIQLDEF